MRALRGPAAVAAVACTAGAALAAGPGQEDNKGLAALLVLPLLAAPLQLLLAALLPGAVKRLSGATGNRVDATIAWGAAVLALALLVAAVPGRLGGQPGQGFAAVVLILTTLGAMVGGAGLSLQVGRWSLRRDGSEGAPTFLAVLVGTTLLGAAMWVPIGGQLLGLGLAVLSLGALVRATIGAPSIGEAGATPPPAAPAPIPPPEGSETGC